MVRDEVNNRPNIVPHAGASAADCAVSVAARDGLDGAQLWETLCENRWFIARIAIVFFLGTALLTLGSRMEFKSRGRLYLGELEGKSGSANGSNELDLSNADQGGLASEAEILQSDSLVSRAVLESGLNVVITPEGWHAPRFLQWLIGKRDPRSVDAGIDELAAVDTTLEESFRGVGAYRVVFTSETDYELWTKPGMLAFLSGGAAQLIGKGKLGEPVGLRGIHLKLTRGTVHGPRSGAAYDIRVTPIDDAIADVSKRLTVAFPKPITQGEVTKVVSLEFRHPSPHLGATFLRHLMRGYIDAHQSWKIEDATAAEAFVSNQLAVIRESLDRTEQRLADYRSNSHVVVLDNEAQALVEQIGKYEEQRIAARLQVTSLSDMKRALKDPKANLEAYLVGDGDDAVLTNLASTLSKARQDLALLEEQYNPAAPDVRQQRAQVDTQLQMIRNYVSNRLTRAQATLDALGHVVNQYEGKLKSVPGAELGLAQLARESEVYSKIYSYLLERQQQTAILKASRISKNRVLDVPEDPYRVDAPNLPTRLGIGALGVVLGCAFVMLRRMFSSKLQSSAELQISGGRLPIWTSIPRFDGLISESRVDFEEAFRTLRIHLDLEEHADGHVVVITSPSAGDGKTTTAFELAAMLAADGRSVLVIDANLHAPSHHVLMGGTQAPGFSDALAQQCDWSEVLYGGVPPGVCSLRAGSRRSPELLSRDGLAQLLDEARSSFNVILLDAPSFPATSDALTLCDHADSVISVVRLRNTSRKLAEEHINALVSRANRFGIVVNEARPALRAARKPRKVRRSAGSVGAGVAVSGAPARDAARERSSEPEAMLAPGEADLSPR